MRYSSVDEHKKEFYRHLRGIGVEPEPCPKGCCHPPSDDYCVAVCSLGGGNIYDSKGRVTSVCRRMGMPPGYVNFK